MTASNSRNYASIRANVDSASDTGTLSRVEVNQRALIDKILARYASQGAVYRELIQNSNDADATEAEIYYTTVDNDATNNSSSNNIVSQVIYRNNGMPFRGQDWDRLKKIAEGNPDVSKVGAFGVGAYTMFSICEEPIVLSGDAALAFVWKGDSLWTKTIPNHQSLEDQKWTSFILPSRDPYTLPDLVEFGEFLCASLTFTAKLKSIKVFFNDQLKLHINKTIAQEPRIVQAPQTTDSSNSSNSSSWLWSMMSQSSNNIVTTSSKGLFTLSKSNNGSLAIYESIHRMKVMIGNDVATLDARYISATAKTNIPSDMAKRMERVTKKNPPSTVDIQIFLNASSGLPSTSKVMNKADKIVKSFVPQIGQGRIFIGFRTSQTTGLAAHLAAPFVPTVEREAMDLQDTALRVFNTELLEFSGLLMRLTLEHTMFNVIGVAYNNNEGQRQKEEAELLMKMKESSVGGSIAAATSKESSIEDEDDEGRGADDDNNGGSSSGGLMGFARFMARGVKKSIVSVAKTMNNFVEANTDKLLYPPDPRPLSVEERQAVVLMQSFCPQQSTPDATVGTYLATGFVKCLPNQLPPVLTKSGVLRGDLARLPNYGIESFCKHNTIRNIIYQNCIEYHTVIARCQKLTIDDLYEAISKEALTEQTAIKLIHWWIKFSRIEPHDAFQRGIKLKLLIKFYAENDLSDCSKAEATQDGETKERNIVLLPQFEYYFDKESYFASQTSLPLPDNVIPRYLQDKIGLSSLTDTALYGWFTTLPIHVWIEYISTTRCMAEGKPEDELLRIQILACLSQEYSKRMPSERLVFGGFCQSLLSNKRCIPFDSVEPTMYSADFPGDLYLTSAELKAFLGVGNTSFYKVSESLHAAGVTDEFLLSLGVRKSVSIDFLFTHLDSLKWSNDPKPLIEYLRTATLTRNDATKLSSTQYLPAENDSNRSTYAPSQLYLPNSDIRIFPFVKILQWPSEPDVSEKSLNGQFMIQLGMKIIPPLTTVFQYLSKNDLNFDHRIKCLDFVCDRLSPHGIYYVPYNQMSNVQRKQFKFLPCATQFPIDRCFETTGTNRTSVSSSSSGQELHSPTTCFYDEICGIMGFPVIDDSRMGNKNNSRFYGSLFQCATEPDAKLLLNQLSLLVTQTKSKQNDIGKLTKESALMIEGTFASIFNYLSHRTTDILKLSSMEALNRLSFIPVRVNDTSIEWFRPDQVYFQRRKNEDNSSAQADSITAELFHVIEFSPFLAAVGVKEEATTRDLFIKVLTSPAEVLKALGSEKKYRSLLRRIAANPPFPPNKIPAEVKKSAFLLAYTVKPLDTNSNGTMSQNESEATILKEGATETISYHLAKANEIYIIDNSFFARMFPKVSRAPPESDLEDFYARLGSRYISQSVDRRFEIVGKPSNDTSLTYALQERLRERGPLLVSPSVTSRPLIPDAAAVLEEKRLQVYEAQNLLAVYSLDGTVRRNQTTCCSRDMGKKTNAIFVVKDFDWFDVGYAIGDLILKRCQLEDAFFISSLLEAPLEQLRSRGFPVDRILQPEPELPDSSRLETPPAPTSIVPPVPVPTIAQVPDSAGVSTMQNKLAANQGKPTQVVEPPSIMPPPNPSKKPDDHPVNNNSNQNNPLDKDELFNILLQMFPAADPDFVRKALGPNPSIDSVRELAESMSSGNYPKVSDSCDNTVSTSNDSEMNDASEKPLKKGGFRKKIGRAFGFGGSSSGSTLPVPPMKEPANGIGQGQSGSFLPPGRGEAHEQQREPVSPAGDAQTQRSLEQMLENAVSTSSNVNPSGTNSNETKLTSIPQELDHCCEIIPAQALKPFPGSRGTGRTRNGIRIFSSRLHPSSESFLNEYDPVIESFAHVIEKLCVQVFSLKIDTIAIFHDPAGSTIAFNSNRSLHFNVRFFYALHFLQNKHLGIDCYSYWYVTIAHELAHHMVTGHTREHGFFTESYVSHYLPKLTVLLHDL